MLSWSASSGEFCWHSHWENESGAHSLPNNWRNISDSTQDGGFSSFLDGWSATLPLSVGEGLPVIRPEPRTVIRRRLRRARTEELSHAMPRCLPEAARQLRHA